jgi:hypothetical protein
MGLSFDETQEKSGDRGQGTGDSKTNPNSKTFEPQRRPFDFAQGRLGGAEVFG